MSEMPQTRIGFVARMQKGRATSEQLQENVAGLPLLSMEYLRGSDETNYEEKFIVPTSNDVLAENGDILILWDGSNAGEFLKAKKGVLSSTLAKVSLSNKIQKDYAFYALKTVEPIIRSECVGMGIPHVNGRFVKALEIFTPSLEEQKTVANFLDLEIACIGQLIEKKEQLVSLLNEKQKAFSSAAVTTGVSENITLEKTNIEILSEVPAHWEIVRIATIFTESSEMGGEDLPVLSVSINWGISDHELSDEDRHRIVNHIKDKNSYKRVRSGDLVYNMMRAWQGAFGVAKVDGLVSPAYVVARSNRELYAPYFEYLLRTPMWIEEFRRASRGIADFRQRLYWEHFRQIRVILPPLNEQINIVAKIEQKAQQIASVVEKVNQSISRLCELRTSLISEAVTGQLDIKSWKKKGGAKRLDNIKEAISS